MQAVHKADRLEKQLTEVTSQLLLTTSKPQAVITRDTCAQADFTALGPAANLPPVRPAGSSHAAVSQDLQAVTRELNDQRRITSQVCTIHGSLGSIVM